MTNKLLLAALSLTAMATPAAAQNRLPATVVAVVDLQRVTSECTACRTAQSQLNSQQQAAQTRVTTLQQQLQAEGQPLQREIEALGSKPAPAALTQRVEAFRVKDQNASQEIQRLQQNLQSVALNVRRQLLERLDTLYPGIMTARGANLLVEKGNTLASSAQLDVTADVLAALNRALPAVSVTPLPQQQQPAQQQPAQRPTGR